MLEHHIAHTTNTHLPLHPGEILFLLLVVHEPLLRRRFVRVSLQVHLPDPQPHQGLQQLRGVETWRG